MEQTLHGVFAYGKSRSIAHKYGLMANLSQIGSRRT